jgi:hypothetical protein
MQVEAQKVTEIHHAAYIHINVYLKATCQHEERTMTGPQQLDNKT